MDALDESWVERKLLTASNTQESVQSLSMWALHHKTQHERIVAIWFRVLKGAKLDLRLTLFYLCNEVVQTCRRRHAVVYKDAFKEVLRDAALLVRDVSIRPNIERIFKIWAERGVYDAEFVDELLVLLNNAKVKTAMSTKLLADFTPNRLMDQLMSCAQLEDAVEEQRQALANVDVNALDVDSFKQQLKDRNQGIEYAEELEAACRQIKNYVNNLETEMKERAALVELLEQSQLYYDAQSSEANVVAMAYKTFGNRVTVVQKRLQEHPALSKASVSSQDSASNQDYDDRQYQVASTDNSTPRSYAGSEDSNSPLPFFDPADYFDRPINDEDIFSFPNDKTTSDVPRRQSTESTPGKISKMEPSRRTPSTEHVHRLSPEPFDLFPSEPYRIGSESDLAHRLSLTEMMPAWELNSRRSAEQSHWMPPTDHMPARERNSRTSSAENSSSVSPSDRTLSRERSNRLSSVEKPHDMSPNDRIPARERSSRTPSAEHSHRMSPTERANLLFPKDSFHRSISSELTRNSDVKVSSELEYDAEPIHKRSKIDLGHGQYVSSVESAPNIANMEPIHRQSSKDSSRKLSTESETSHRNRKYSYSSSSSSLPPQHTTSPRTWSKDNIGSDNYVQPALSFLPRNIASLGSQKHPPDLSNLFPNSEVGRGGATPTRDEEEGGATPVLDEPDDDELNYSSPLDQTSGANKPTNSYMQLSKTNMKGSSDHNAHLERQSYSTGSDIGSDVASGYDKVKSNTHYAADLNQTRSRVADNSRSSAVSYPSDVSERYRPTAESFHCQDVYHPSDQDHHPSRVAVTISGYHQSPAGTPLQSAPTSVVDNFQVVLPVDLPQPVTYYPVVIEQYPNSSYNDTPKPQIYQPSPDFSHPPPALFNPSLPPPGMSVSSISLVPQQNPQPPSASPSYSLPPPLPPHSGAMVLQQPGAMVNSAPPPRVVQITVLPSHVDVYSAPQLPTSSHLPPMLPPTSAYSTHLAAPPRRNEHIATPGDYNNDLPPPGGYIATIGGNGDARRNTYSHTELTQTQPIRSITSCRRNDDREYSVGTLITNAPTLSSNKGHVLTSMPEGRFDYLDHSGHAVYDPNETGVARTEQEAHRIPTLGYSVHNDHRGQRTVHGSQPTPHSQPPWS